MADLSLQYGADLNIGPTGDLLLTDVPELTEQRVLRRLLTNQGDYIWHLTYGAGLGQFVGQPGASAAIAAVARSQMSLEASVALTPAPSVIASVNADSSVSLAIGYTDSTTGSTAVVTFSM